jgi:hypothetical protein
MVPLGVPRITSSRGVFGPDHEGTLNFEYPTFSRGVSGPLFSAVFGDTNGKFP